MKTANIGKPGPANETLGGVPELYYYDFASKGRGEVMRLFFEEAGIAFVDHRWSFEERNGMSEEEKAKENPLGSVPFIRLDGKIYAQTYPLLRYWANKLGRYDGKTPEEKYYVDSLNDIALDWRSKFVDSAFTTDPKGLGPNEDKGPFKNHKDYILNKYVQGIEGRLKTGEFGSDGPFVLGKELTYADLVIFQIYHDEREVGGIDLSNAPHVEKLVKAVSDRPNIKAYFASDRYYN